VREFGLVSCGTLPPAEIETWPTLPVGRDPQGRIGIGYSTLQARASNAAATAETLSIAEDDRRLAMIATKFAAQGSAARRAQAPARPVPAGDSPEQQFLLRENDNNYVVKLGGIKLGQWLSCIRLDGTFERT